jgi:hypothetical protein
MEQTLRLYKCINVIMTARHVRDFVVGNVVDIPLIDEGLVKNPWGVRDDLINPATMAHSLASISVVIEYSVVGNRSNIPLSLCHHTACFMGDNVLIGVNTSE